MNVFRQNGVTSLSEMRRLYDLSSPLVETTDTTKTNAAPMFRAGGRRKANLSPQGVSEGDQAFVGPSSKHLMVGPEVPYGFNDAPIDWERKKALQHYAESSFLPNQVSRAGAAGPYQIMPRIWNHYKDKLGLTGSPQDYNNSEAVRDTMMEGLLNAGWVNKGFPSDSVRAAKAFMGYNWGSGNATNFLEDMKRQGVDIYHSMDWVDMIPNDETRNYVNYILRERDIPGGKTIAGFEKALPHRFDAFPEAKKYDMGGPELIERINSTSKANFVQRLKDKDRKAIPFRNTGAIATHRLGYAEDENGAIVYPEVQEINGELVDLGRIPNTKWAALDSAIEHGDTLRMTAPQAAWFTQNYKQYYPFDKGGKIHIKPENRGKFNALKKRTGKTTEELTHSKNPLTRKRAIFAQNAARWSHKKCYGGIKF